MIVYFADRKMNILEQASTELPKGLRIVDDMKTEEIDVGVNSLHFYLPYTEKTREDAERCTAVGNYLLKQGKRGTEFYTIIDTEADTKSEEIYVYAEDAGLDLLNEINGPYEADKAYPIAHYIQYFAMDTGFEIQVNEIANLSRKLKWEGEETTTARLLSVATQFDNAEISYEFVIKGMRVIKKYINVFKKRGKDTGSQLFLNREIDRIITKKSIANLATGLIVTGGTPEGKEKPITLEGYQYDDGRFYVSGKYLFDREANALWNRYLMDGTTGESHIVQPYSYDTLSQPELCNRAVSKLKKISSIEVNYEIDITDLPEEVEVGDTVNIVDEEGGLYLSARALRLETSEANQTYKATLGEYLIRDGGISQRVEELAEQFKAAAAERAEVLYTWVVYADDANGTGASLSPEGKEYIAIVPNRTTASADLSDPSLFDWVKVKGDSGEIGPPGEPGGDGPPGDTTYFHIRYSPVEEPTAEQMTVTPDVYIGTYVDFIQEDSPDPAVYTWYRFQGLQGEQGDRGIPGENGFDGNTSYLHIKYSDDGGLTLTGNSGEMPGAWIGQYVDFYQPDSEDPTKYTWTKVKGDPGADGVGIQNVANRYALSDSSTEEPEVWSDAMQVMDKVNRYLWSYEVIYYTDGTSGSTNKRIIGVYGDEGNGIQSIKEYYLASGASSGIKTTTSGWTTSVQTTDVSKKYLWNYEEVFYTDGSKYTSEPVIIGTHGDTGPTGKDAAVVSNAEPDDKSYLWCDTSSEPPILKRWNGVDWSVVNDDSEQIFKIYQDVNTAITEAGNNILLQVNERTYSMEEVDQLLSVMGTELRQTKNSFEFEFNNLKNMVDTITSTTDGKFENVNKYIRFIDGAIYIGIDGNPMVLKQSNDRISFLENNTEVAYISNRTMYITHAEVLKDLKIGRFAWVYMDSGYLPLKKVQ